LPGESFTDEINGVRFTLTGSISIGRHGWYVRSGARTLDRGAQADARGAPYGFSQVLDRSAQVVAAAPRRCRSRRRTNLLISGVKLSGYAPSWLLPAVARR
jgi:hypothetical protein